MKNTSEKIILWIVKIGILTIPFIPLYVSGTMLFPFITGKNFAFRIIVEILFALWLGLAIANSEYRPRLTPLVKAMTLFMVILFLADLFGANPYRSFFSNYERMEGFMMLSHLYLYFLVLVSVYKKKNDWLIFFHVALLSSILVSYIAVLQKLGYRPSIQGGYRVDSTIGNPTYLAAYTMFFVWMLGILLWQFWKNKWLRTIYSLLLVFETAIVFFTATRGATLALVGVSILFFATISIFGSNVWINKKEGAAKEHYKSKTAVWLYSILIFLVVVPLAFWQFRGANFIRSNPTLKRLTNYSFQERTIKSRFEIWNMAFKGVLERPILGWGQENFYLVFQKYYDPRLWDQEQWFDRSHNVIFDWLVHTGFLGLLSYLLIFASAAWMIIRLVRKDRALLFPGLLLLSAFLSYFIQNIFVFDNLSTYLMFFSFLAYTNYAFSDHGRQSVVSGKSTVRRNVNPMIYSIVFLLAVLAAMHSLHIKPIKEAKALIETMKVRYVPDLTLDQLASYYRKALSYHTFGDTEVREQLGGMANNSIFDTRFSTEDRKKFLEFAVDELKKEAVQTGDVKHVVFLGSLLSGLKSFDPKYVPEAEKVLQEAIRLSPTKQPVYFEASQFYVDTGRTEQAISLLQKAWDLDRTNYFAASNLWTIGILAKRSDIIEEIKKSLGFDEFNENQLYRFALAYQKVQDFKNAQEIYEKLVVKSPKVAQYHATLAALLSKSGRIKEAIKQAEEAAKLDKNFEPEARMFIDSLKR